jgi:hypothetical protein
MLIGAAELADWRLICCDGPTSLMRAAALNVVSLPAYRSIKIGDGVRER